MKYVSGTEKVINNLILQKSKILRAAAGVVEKTAVDIAVHAKSDHADEMAHCRERYQNQTTTLTRSITPELTKVTPELVEAQVFSYIHYAPYVEAIYPFLWPALVASQKKFKQRLHDELRRLNK